MEKEVAGGFFLYSCKLKRKCKTEKEEPEEKDLFFFLPRREIHSWK
jgi:hypothetical protein